MKQRFLCIAIVLVMISGICGCGSRASASAPAPAEWGKAGTYNATSETQNGNSSEPVVKDTYTVDELVAMMETGEMTEDVLYAMAAAGSINENTVEETLRIMDERVAEKMDSQGSIAEYELNNICMGISDSGNGYKAEFTISTTDWIRASDSEMLQRIWENIGGRNALPSISNFHELSNDGFTNENAAIAFGTLSFRNVTNGFSFTESSPRTFTCILDAGEFYFKGHRVEGYIEYSNCFQYFSLTPWSVLSAEMKRDSWGAVPFMLVCSNAFTPEYPDGDEDLNNCRIKCNSEDLVLKLALPQENNR